MAAANKYKAFYEQFIRSMLGIERQMMTEAERALLYTIEKNGDIEWKRHREVNDAGHKFLVPIKSADEWEIIWLKK